MSIKPQSSDESSAGVRAHELSAFLAAIVTSSDDAIVGKTLDGTIQSWNTGAERVFGYRADEIIGRSILTIVPPELHDEEAGILARLARGQRIDHFETERVRKDGRRVRVSLTVSPIRDARGRIVGASKVARDITERIEVEAKARRDARTLEAVIEAAPVAISLMDPDGVVRMWNTAAARLFGWSKEEVIGRLPPTVDDAERVQFRDHLQRTLAGDGLRGVETVRASKSGGTIEVALWSSLVSDEDDTAHGVVSIAIDLAERRRAESALRDSEDRFRTLADNIAQFAWMADSSGWIFWYNERWFEYTGTTLPEMEGWGWKKVHHPDHVDRVVEKFSRSIASGTHWEDTFPLRGRDGSYRWFLSRALPIRDATGAVTRWFGTNTDITERMAMEEALREADRRKDQFLATLAHELRNPLAPIQSGLDRLALRLAEAGEVSEAANVLPVLRRQTAHLVRLVDDLLDVSRISSGKIELRRQPVALAEIVHHAVETARPQLDVAGHHVEVRIDDNPVVDGDPVRLTQVFANLLNNAAKHTPAGGRVQLLVERSGDRAVARVVDSGAGIAPEMLERIFDLFVQGGGAGADSGLGIGLTLARSLVELHGGRLLARSSGLGQGSEFQVCLPLHAARPGAAPRAPAAAAGAAALRVLIADDNRDAADIMQGLLEALGHHAVAAYGGAQALAMVDEVRPHVVLLDLGMPDMDGFETVRQLRARPGGDAIAVCALTGWGQDADRQRTSAAGFDHHLVKPIDLERLRALLTEVAARLGR